MGSGEGLCLPRKFLNFSFQNGVIWCILGVLFLRFMCPMEKNKTLAKILGVVNTGQILGVATSATPLALTPMSKYFAPIAGGGKVA